MLPLVASFTNHQSRLTSTCMHLSCWDRAAPFGTRIRNISVCSLDDEEIAARANEPQGNTTTLYKKGNIGRGSMSYDYEIQKSHKTNLIRVHFLPVKERFVLSKCPLLSFPDKYEVFNVFNRTVLRSFVATIASICQI